MIPSEESKQFLQNFTHYGLQRSVPSLVGRILDIYRGKCSRGSRNLHHVYRNSRADRASEIGQIHRVVSDYLYLPKFRAVAHTSLS